MAGGGPQGTQAFASTLTDLMTSLAVIFVLLLTVFLKQSHDKSKQAKDEVREQLNAVMMQKSLNLSQDPDDPLTLTVKVGENQLRFPLGGSSLSSEGRDFVGGFFKSFATRICDKNLRDKIDSILIEGHTDKVGEGTPEGVRANIMLSQRRSFAVLEHALSSVQGNHDVQDCLLKLSSATGRGSQSPILANGQYSANESRRVEIRIRVRSSEQQLKEDFKSALPVTQTSGPAPQPAAPPARSPGSG